MRSINISTEVFAKIWSLHQEGEETEDEVLHRILGVKRRPERNGNKSTESKGYFDGRHNVHFPENFKIFRIYKGQVYTAIVENGKWLLENNAKLYGSLNQLSQAVIDRGRENAWVSWWYADSKKERRLISELRDELTIGKRNS